jgi:hypothetical protein
MVGDEVMAVEIIMESMAMMKAKKSPLRSEEGDKSGPEILVSDGDSVWFAKSYMPLGLGFFLVHKEAYQRTHQEGPRGPNGLAPRGQEVNPRGAPYLAPHGSHGPRLQFKFVLFHKNFRGIYFGIYFLCYLHRIDRNEFFY